MLERILVFRVVLSLFSGFKRFIAAHPGVAGFRVRGLTESVQRGARKEEANDCQRQGGEKAPADIGAGNGYVVVHQDSPGQADCG